MTDDPVLDGRDREDILDATREIAPNYIDSWEPQRDDAGTALLAIFADIAEDVVERLDRIPEKQRAAFLDSLGFNNHPPQPSKLPVTFTVDNNETGNVGIPVGTTVESVEVDDYPAREFETVGDRKFQATPAAITDAYGVDPGTDRVVEHWSTLAREEQTKLFTGTNRQQHAFYLGDSELLQLDPGATIELELTTNAPFEAVRDYLEWEYFGENEDGEEGWHPLVVHGQDTTDTRLSEVQQVESFLERLDSFLEREGYVRTQEHSEFDLLVRSIADDVRKGRFGSPQEDDAGGPALPTALFEGTDVRDVIVRKIQHQLETLHERLQRSAVGADFSESFDQTTLSFDIPGEVTESELDGVESRWIRGRIPDDELVPALFNTLIESVTLSVGTETSTESAGLALTEAVSNDVALDLDSDEPLLLLGENPTGAATFAFACREAFTKSGATVTMTFEHADETPVATYEPDLSWEYWNGTGWRRLSVTDDTDALQTSGTVTFDVPADLEPTTEQGQEALWIRTRLIGGDYGQPKMEEVEPNNWERVTDHISAPRYSNIRVTYDQSSIPFDHCVTHNTLSYSHVDPGEAEFAPFESPPGDTQALYLGFDSPLEGGPINLYLPLLSSVYPDDFNAWIDAEYCSDPHRDQWDRIDLRDGTEDLSELGILQLTFPETTTSFELFGSDRHWIRIRVTGDEFARSNQNIYLSTAEMDASGGRHRELAYQDIATRERRNRTRTPPELTGIHPNTQWAKNIESISDEILGSSSGTADQEFEFSHEPVFNATVWIEESEILSEREADALIEDESVTVQEERDDDGTRAALWVRWKRVPDFHDSEPAARHYVLNETNGRLLFGDGQTGAIPPEGENNVKVEYQTGGGDDGDVPAGAVENLIDPIPFVEEVTNPEPGKTGEDIEPLPELVRRAPNKLRDRGKPVTRDGFKRIALSASRGIERVKVKAGKDETGAPGKVTLLIVPDEDPRKPVPAEDLIDDVEAEMRERAPAAVIDGSQSHVTVRGPHYVEVSVEATVETAGDQSATDVIDMAESELTAFAHPLTGGPDGEGWEIGRAPQPSVFAAHLEQLDAVKRVTNLAVTFRDGKQRLTLAGSEDAPRVSPDVLIYSGRHDVTVDVGGE